MNIGKFFRPPSIGKFFRPPSAENVLSDKEQKHIAKQFKIEDGKVSFKSAAGDIPVELTEADLELLRRQS
jgi:hypothetical protein